MEKPEVSRALEARRIWRLLVPGRVGRELARLGLFPLRAGVVRGLQGVLVYKDGDRFWVVAGREGFVSFGTELPGALEVFPAVKSLEEAERYLAKPLLAGALEGTVAPEALGLAGE